MSDLPTSLKVELSQEMYKKVVANIEFFENKSSFFIAAVAPKLKRVKFSKNECYFRRGNPIDGSESFGNVSLFLNNRGGGLCGEGSQCRH